MWIDLPFDVLAKIFSFLSPESLACAGSACRYWHKCAKACPLASASASASNWFVALPMRNNTNLCCYAHNPISNNWHSISIDFLPCPVRPVTSIQSLILFRTTNPTSLDLIVCNPFTREFKKLPELNTPRSNPAVGLVAKPGGGSDFEVYVAGGTSAEATYEAGLEVYDSARGAWRVAASVPAEFAVRLTVWTPVDGVRCGGALYWITSARAYSLIGCGVASNTWRTVRVPMAERLEFAALVLRRGNVAVVGGTCGGEAHVWELGEGESWVVVGKVPAELGSRFVGERESWVNTKCVSSDGLICLYGSLGSGMIVWKEVGELGKWEWFWVEGCRFLGGKKVPDLMMKGVLVPPKLSSSTFFLS